MRKYRLVHEKETLSISDVKEHHKLTADAHAGSVRIIQYEPGTNSWVSYTKEGAEGYRDRQLSKVLEGYTDIYVYDLTEG